MYVCVAPKAALLQCATPSSQGYALMWLCLLLGCIGVPSAWIPLGLGLVVEDKPSELSCTL